MKQLCAGDTMLRWVRADSALLQSVTAGQSVERGTLGRRLQNILTWADRCALVGPVLFAVGLSELLLKLRQQRTHRCTNERLSRLFVGFGAGAEETLFKEYCEKWQGPVARANQVDVASMGRIHRVGGWKALRTLWAACRAVVISVRELPDALGARRIDFLTHGGLRLGGYTYMRAWFEGVREQCMPNAEVCFLAADTPAFAAADAGANTRYLQHGFIRRSLLLPCFSSVEALTEDEAAHFRRSLPGARVCVRDNEPLQVSAWNPVVLVASVYECEQEMKRILPILSWAKESGWKVLVRPHPREDRSFWSERVDRNSIQIEDCAASFHDALKHLRPRIVVSWYSTALADALNCGIVPVTVSDESTPAVSDMVYPLFKRALRWPQDRQRIAEIMKSDDAYRETLRSLRGEVPSSRE
jgi:hypothetical protein